MSFGDVRLATRMMTVSVQSPLWEVNVTSKPIYGLAMPNASEHRNGVGEWDVQLLAKDALKRRLWEADQRRLDFEISGAFPQPEAHGVIGQSYRDATVRWGRIDIYGAGDTPALIQSDGTGPEIWRQTGGGLDAFSCAMGTGGTLTVGLYSSSNNLAFIVLNDNGLSLFTSII